MTNKIILVTGPHEGVGKTTLAANLAAHYAKVRRQPVMLIPLPLLLAALRVRYSVWFEANLGPEELRSIVTWPRKGEGVP